MQDNQPVKKGDVLFEIDPEDYKLVLEKAKAEFATVDRQLAQAQDTLHRLEPLLPSGFETAENVDEARTAVTTLQAQREGAVATINLEELHLSYCKVIAPFDGRVINLNISAGAHVTAGVPVFSFLDTTKWYVIANFREARDSTHGSRQPKRLFTSRPRLTSASMERCRESDGQLSRRASSISHLPVCLM